MPAKQPRIPALASVLAPLSLSALLLLLPSLRAQTPGAQTAKPDEPPAPVYHDSQVVTSFPPKVSRALPENRHIWPLGTIPAQGKYPGEARPYTDPAYYTALVGGNAQSIYIQPWRGYLDTWPWSRLTDVAGINMNGTPPRRWDAVCAHLKTCGIKHARFEIGWGALTYAAPHHLPNEEETIKALQAMARNGIRPLILLNSNHAAPCPMAGYIVYLTQDAKKGDRTVRLSAADAAKMAPGRSGLSYITPAYKACDVLFTAISPDGVATLAKPLPRDIPKKEGVAAHVLAYRPLWPARKDGTMTPEGAETLAGWKDYAHYICTLAKRAGVAVDLECWNEPTFGSDFVVSSDRYYEKPPVPDAEHYGLTADLVMQATIAAASEFPGVGVTNGFASQTWHWAGSNAVPGAAANSRHPYHIPSRFEFTEKTPPLPNPLLGPDGTVITPVDKARSSAQNGTWYQVGEEGSVPAHVVNFPEADLTGYYAGSECLLSDLSPLTLFNLIPRGRKTRPQWPDGSPAPTPELWITEVNIGAWGVRLADPQTDPAKKITKGLVYSTPSGPAADLLHQKIVLRYYTAYAAKGAARVYLFAVGDNSGLGLIDTDVLKTGASVPSQPSAAFLPWTRLLSHVSATPIKHIRTLSVAAVRDDHNAIEIPGIPGKSKPLYRRETVMVAPFQTGDTAFAILTYAMTRNVGRHWQPQYAESDPRHWTMPPETYTIELNGIGPDAKFDYYDPITGTSTPVAAKRNGSAWNLPLPLTDYPRLLLINGA